ncbi:hypothetical protein CCHR01_19403 [Colletotrichum chrysophilum]|uniref:Heterokaryon incompatibility domain-containing protein n=1 Tax=Colletotrichum chrysophilum TaxID=1836956 RepID=A0AAD9E782_9PEZI|nr:hypothetical protein CCHR01_19403 [Colletotrichum chrysophilum]
MSLWTRGEIDFGNGELLDRRQIKSLTAQIGDLNLSGETFLCGSFALRTYDTGFEIHQRYPAVHDTSTGSQKAISVAKQWLHTCKTSPEHSICRDTYGPSESCSALPTRVLCVGSQEQDPFLLESNGLKQRYCILSYYWGLSGNAITTKSNLSDRTKGIPLASLPTLLRQAVIATRSLGYEYLWIDALCIIQDDPDDWAREAAMMHVLYSRADLTITSLVAADSRDSLFESRPRESARPIPLKISLPKRCRHPFVEGSVFEYAAYPHRDRLDKSGMEGPVNQRAWTLQEQLMSTRVLYFGHGILHRECLCSYQLEWDPEGMSTGDVPITHQGWKSRKARRRTKHTVKTLQEGGSQ